MLGKGIRSGVKRLFRLPLTSDARAAADADAELRVFLAERVDYLVRRGMPPADARAEALRRLGAPLSDTTLLLHASAARRERHMRLRDMMHDFLHDFRYAIRTLRRDARFAAFAALILGVGIGATVIVFSVANALLVRPLPFQDPDRLVWIENGLGAGLSAQTIQVANYLDYEQQNRSFEGLGAYMAFYGIGDTRLSGEGASARLSVVPVSRNFFPVLGVQPILGRQFSAEESLRWNGPKVVLLSNALWRTRFASDPGIVGRSITLNDAAALVVGVLPASFDFGAVFAPGTRIDMFVPFPLTDETDRWGNTISVVGRLKDNVTLGQAAAESRMLGARITAAASRRNEFDPRLTSLREHVSGRVEGALGVLAFAVGVVMLIVCANMSNLLLVRATTRRKEMAVRAALGASRRRLVRQMLTESVVLSSFGAALGMVLAIVGTRAVARLDAVALPLLGGVRIDPSAVAFTLILAVVTGLAFGLVPALNVPAAVHEELKSSGRAVTEGKRGNWTRSFLVVAEIALACVLLVGSGLLIRSFLKVMEVDLGFRPGRVATLRVDPGAGWTTSRERMNAYFDEVPTRTSALPGVQSVALADRLPLGSNRSWGVAAKGRTSERSDWQPAFVRVVSEGYVGTMGMRLIAGREITIHDGPKSEPVIMINETLARALWPGEDALGKVMSADGDRRVVGIIGDVRHLALEEGAGNEMYIPMRQTGDFPAVNLVIRSTLAPVSLGAAVRNALQSVMPDLPTNDLRTLSQVVDKAVSPRRFITLLLGAFAVFALVLALLGIYGVISYTVSHRTQEIGVRIALGASSGHVQRRIIGETLALASAGIAIGAAGAWLLGRALRGFLFGVTPTDPLTFGAMLFVLAAVAVLSGWVPARRASRIDPIGALRSN